MKFILLVLACWAFQNADAYKNYNGHKVITVVPKTDPELELIHKLHSEYSIDLWTEVRMLGSNVMMHLTPDMIEQVESLLRKENITFDVAFHNLQSAIDEERQVIYHSPSSADKDGFDFGNYQTFEKNVKLMEDLSSKYPKIAKLEIIGTSYEKRPIYSLKISKGDSLKKPAIIVECGIHAREWTSVATCSYFINKLITSYGSDKVATDLVDKYEINVVLISNPDGYVFTWVKDRLWRKTRSKNPQDLYDICPGADANRNFDIDHCGVGTSKKPCDITYCGVKPFSESEVRALRDLMFDKKGRAKAYISLHAYSQLWMTPYGIKKSLPPNYDEIERVGQAGVDALAKKYGTKYILGPIAKVIYPATGSSVDYAYEKADFKIAYALELRDRGQYAFMLPPHLLLPTCEETYDGLVASMQAMK